jgi:hypothetical protein
VRRRVRVDLHAQRDALLYRLADRACVMLRAHAASSSACPSWSFGAINPQSASLLSLSSRAHPCDTRRVKRLIPPEAVRAAKLSRVPGVTIAQACERLGVSRAAVERARRELTGETPPSLS